MRTHAERQQALPGEMCNTPLRKPIGITPLCARDDDAANGKLKVAPCFLPNFLTGPYWVIALTSASDGTYTGAAIIGGNPSVAALMAPRPNLPYILGFVGCQALLPSLGQCPSF